MDFENEDDAKQSMAPKTIVEVLGISEWDGKGRANNYPNGFLVVTHTGNALYYPLSFYILSTLNFKYKGVLITYLPIILKKGMNGFFISRGLWSAYLRIKSFSLSNHLNYYNNALLMRPI